MANDENDYRRTKGALASLGAIAVALYAGYQLIAIGRVSWTTLGFLLFLIAAVLGNRYMLRLGAERDDPENPRAPN